MIQTDAPKRWLIDAAFNLKNLDLGGYLQSIATALLR